MVTISDLKIGTVIDIRDPYSYDDKHKYSIIVGISEDEFTIATVFINSEINPTAINSPGLVALQYGIKQTDYNFLKRDSFVDCSKITDRIQLTFLNEINNSGRLLGNIRITDLRNIVNLVTGAESISPYYIKLCNIKPIL